MQGAEERVDCGDQLNAMHFLRASYVLARAARCGRFLTACMSPGEKTAKEGLEHHRVEVKKWHALGFPVTKTAAVWICIHT
ncbi:hypothetical protein MHYP_G00238230 [Metynnis hypsauchen]